MADDTQPVASQDPAVLFKAMPRERQLALLGKMSQQQKNTLFAKLKTQVPEQTVRQKIDTALDPKASAPMYQRIAAGVARVPVGIAETAYDLAKPPQGRTEKILDITPGGLPIKRAIVDPAIGEFHKAVDDYNKGHYSEMLGHGAAGLIPLVGPWAASMGERAGKGDIAGTAAELVTGLAAPKIAEKVMPTVDSLNQRAAKLSAKVYKTADATKKGMGLSTPLQAAQEGIIGSYKTLGDKVDAARSAKHAERVAAYDAATKQGVTVDVSKEVQPIIDRIKQAKSNAGTLTKDVIEDVDGFVKKLTTKTMPDGSIVPRDLTKLTPNDIQSLTGQVKGEHGLLTYDESASKAVQNVSNEVRQKFLDKLDEKLPQAGKLRVEESRLQENRDAVRKQYEQILNDKASTGRGVLYKGAGPMAVYFGIRGLGLGLMAPVLGTIAMYKALASAVSRTARAALYAKAASLLDAHVATLKGPQGPQMGSGGPLARPQGTPPVSPTGATVSGALPAAVGSHAPFAEVVDVRTNPAPVTQTRGTMLPEKGSRAKAGSGDYVKKSVSSIDASKQAAPDVNVAKSNTKEAPKADTSARNKAMMDRLDTILNTKPTSGAHNAALQREAAEIKKVLSGEADPKEQSKINKRIADRERLASKRAESASAAPVGEVSSTGEAVSQAASPEERSIQLDLGYKGLARFENGPEMVKALQKHAKEMAQVDPSYDELEQLKQAVKALIDIGERPRGDL